MLVVNLNQVFKRELFTELVALARLLLLQLLVDVLQSSDLLVLYPCLLVDFLLPLLQIEEVVLLHVVFLSIYEQLLIFFIGEVKLLLQGQLRQLLLGLGRAL